MSQELKLEELYMAPPERVFQAWTEPEQVRKWFGCGPGQLWTVHEWDCQRGGRLAVSMYFGERRYEVLGEFLEVVPPERLVYRFGAERVEVEFIREGDATRLRLLHRDIPSDRDVEIRTGGWSYCLGTSLGHYLSGA